MALASKDQHHAVDTAILHLLQLIGTTNEQSSVGSRGKMRQTPPDVSRMF
jgi:hypothetical protein